MTYSHLRGCYPGGQYNVDRNDDDRALFIEEGPYNASVAVLTAPRDGDVPRTGGMLVHIERGEAIRLGEDLLRHFAPQRLILAGAWNEDPNRVSWAGGAPL